MQEFVGMETWCKWLHLVNCCISIIQIALVNNFLKLGLNELKLCFRVRLTKHLYDEYLK